jgi:hypothetical protein
VKLTPHSRIKAEGLAIWLILLAILGGAVWLLYSSRADSEKNARIFANDVAQKVVLNYDEKYLDQRLSPHARNNYSVVWRARMMRYLREFGPLSKPIETKGDVHFTSQFFEPRGSFRSELTYPTQTAFFELTVSKGMTTWQVDDLNLVWNPPPAPTPTPSPAMTPSPTPSPTPAQKPRRKRGRG